MSLSVLATLGVVAVGAVDAILFAVVLALLRFIRLISRPSVEILGKVEGFPGFHSLARHERGQSLPGLLLFRFNAPITFFNAPYFKRELLRAVDEAGPGLRRVVIDLLPVTSIDATGLLTVTELGEALNARGIGLNAAGRLTEWDIWAAERGFGGYRIGAFPDLAPSRARAIVASAVTLINVKAASSQAHTLAIEMKPLPHSYEVTLTGGATGYATISTDGVPPLSSAPPKDFDGPGDAWSPEHLLLASVEACFMFTFRAVARGSNFDFLALDLSSRGTVDRKDGATRFTEIVLKPRLTLPKGADPERAHRVLEKGKTACLVTASLSVPVRLEAEILAAD